MPLNLVASGQDVPNNINVIIGGAAETAILINRLSRR